MLNETNTNTTNTTLDFINAAMRTVVSGHVAAEVIKATIKENGTGELLLAAPVDPAGVALIQARLQPTPRAQVAWKMCFGALGLAKGEDIAHAVGKIVVVTCCKTKDSWGTWYINSIRRWYAATPAQAETCRAGLDRIRPRLEQVKSYKRDDDRDDQAITPQGIQNPAVLDDNAEEYELPF